MTKTKTPSKDLLVSLGWTTKSNTYSGECVECGRRHEAQDARVVRHPSLGMGANWQLICKSMKCTAAFVRPQAAGGVSDPSCDIERSERG